MCRNFPFVDCMCWVSLSGRLELQLEQVGPWAVQAAVGAGSGYRESQGQATLNPGVIAEASRVCMESRRQAVDLVGLVLGSLDSLGC